MKLDSTAQSFSPDELVRDLASLSQEPEVKKAVRTYLRSLFAAGGAVNVKVNPVGTPGMSPRDQVNQPFPEDESLEKKEEMRDTELREPSWEQIRQITYQAAADVGLVDRDMIGILVNLLSEAPFYRALLKGFETEAVAMPLITRIAAPSSSDSVDVNSPLYKRAVMAAKYLKTVRDSAEAMEREGETRKAVDEEIKSGWKSDIGKAQSKLGDFVINQLNERLSSYFASGRFTYAKDLKNVMDWLGVGLNAVSKMQVYKLIYSRVYNDILNLAPDSPAWKSYVTQYSSEGIDLTLRNGKMMEAAVKAGMGPVSATVGPLTYMRANRMFKSIHDEITMTDAIKSDSDEKARKVADAYYRWLLETLDTKSPAKAAIQLIQGLFVLRQGR